MDLLSAIGTGRDEKSRLNVVASLLRYLIDPHADHGLSARLLREILSDTSQTWPVIDQALLDALDCFPGIPDLHIQIADADGHRSVVLVQYETAHFVIGLLAYPSGVTTTSLFEDMVIWNRLVADGSRWSWPERNPRITRTHKGLVLFGTPQAATGPDPLDLLARFTRATSIDAVHCLRWQASGPKAYLEQRSIQEVIAATIHEVGPVYSCESTLQTIALLRRLHRAVGTSFRFDL